MSPRAQRAKWLCGRKWNASRQEGAEPPAKAQGAALETLKDDPALKNVTLLQANYDTEKALKKKMNIRTQSTFVVFKGKTEVARSAGVTDADKIKAILAAGL